jgi:hypothetical protein
MCHLRHPVHVHMHVWTHILTHTLLNPSSLWASLWTESTLVHNTTMRIFKFTLVFLIYVFCFCSTLGMMTWCTWPGCRTLSKSCILSLNFCTHLHMQSSDKHSHVNIYSLHSVKYLYLCLFALAPALYTGCRR